MVSYEAAAMGGLYGHRYLMCTHTLGGCNIVNLFMSVYTYGCICGYVCILCGCNNKIIIIIIITVERSMYNNICVYLHILSGTSRNVK